MPYYDTIDEDLKRAKHILERGCDRADGASDSLRGIETVRGGTIFASDIYAAYKLLESFVEHITYLHQQTEACHNHIEELETFKQHAKTLNKTAAAEIERLRVEKRGQFESLVEIRRLCDQATGIDRTRGDVREVGALGAAKALIAEVERLRAVLQHTEADLRAAARPYWTKVNGRWTTKRDGR
jgi:hypothetical protein